MEKELCACDTRKTFAECCEPALKGLRVPTSPVELMRSRYTAFARHDIDYILRTVAPAARKNFDRKEIEDWSTSTDWMGLEIVATQKGGPEDKTGQVEFIAKFRDNGEEQKHHELASFVKIEGAWYFEDGRTPPVKQVRLEGPKIGRNDPCHCGSGKKFKKCHGTATA